jgi:integrase
VPRASEKYLVRKGNTFWFRRGIPAPIRPAFGGTAFYLANLQTSDLREAKARRDQLAKECEAAFTAAREGRGRRSAEDHVKALAEEWAKQRAESRDDPHAWTARYYGKRPDEIADEDVESVEALIQEQGERIEAEHGEGAAETFANIAYGRVAVDHHLDAYLSEARLAPKTKNERRGIIRRFAAWADKKRLTLPRVGRRQAGEYVAGIIVPMHKRTAKKHLTALKGYWDYLYRRDHVPDRAIWENLLLPDRGRRVERGAREEERPFTTEEVRTLLYAPLPAGGRGRQFEEQIADAMRIAALTGMRLAEIVTLLVSECQGGFFDVGQGKNASAVRRVPIHPDLLEIVARRTEGKKPEDWLFHELRRERDAGDTFGKRFARYREALGVDDRRDGRRRSLVNFHSFRRWFVTEAEQAGQPESTIAAVVGHSEGRRSITFGVYSGGPSEDQLRRCVETVRLPPPSA